jgi:hypothetical protein
MCLLLLCAVACGAILLFFARGRTDALLVQAVGSLRLVNEEAELSDNLDAWEIRLQMPGTSTTHVMAVLEALPEKTWIDVDLVLSTVPTKRFLGKIGRETIEPRVRKEQALAVRIHPVRGDIPPDLLIPAKFLLRGTDVVATLHCEP